MNPHDYNITVRRIPVCQHPVQQSLIGFYL